MKYLITILPLLLFVGCAQEQGEPEVSPDFVDFTKAAALTWNEAWAAGDANAIANQYAADALLLPPNSDPIEGSAAILEFWTAAIAAAPGGGITSVEAVSAGAVGVEHGTYVSEGPDGEHLDHGKFLVLWRLVDGEWKMHRDMWNSNMAPAGAEGDSEM